VAPAFATTPSRSNEVAAPPPARTLVTRDGAATFVEVQTGRSDARRFYSYAFRFSPLPVTHYSATLRVTPNGPGASAVARTHTWEAQKGQEGEARKALAGIYEAGPQSIRAKLTR